MNRTEKREYILRFGSIGKVEMMDEVKKRIILKVALVNLIMLLLHVMQLGLREGR